MDVSNLKSFLSTNLQDAELSPKLNEMMNYILSSVVEDLKDTKYKYTQPELLREEAIKQIIIEQGYDYVAGVMDTIEGLQFNTMLSFVDLINQLKGTRVGLELVLKLLGFDSIIKEWWQNTVSDKEPWSYDIVIVMNTSNVPDIYNTLDKIKIFSENYVIANIANIDVRFSASRFAEKAPIMGGFEFQKHRGKIIRRAIPLS